MMSTQRLSELADTISLNIKAVERYLSDNGLPTPSTDAHGPSETVIADKSADAARCTALGAMHELRCLMLGPTSTLMSIESEDILCLQAIYRYEIDLSFGVGEEASFETISAKCGLNVVDLRRILRLAMTNHIFREPRAGVVAHTALSRVLAQDSRLRDYIGMVCEERFPASARTVDALSKYGFSRTQAQSGFALSQNTSLGLYEELRHHPERERRWASAMSAIASHNDFDFIIQSFDWKTYASGTVVDVGGGCGTISEGLALHLPNLKFIVQDSEAMIAKSSLAQEVKNRVSLMPHDFFQEQPVKGAEIYYFRNIFHNWPDDKCIDILRNLIPALTPGAHVIIDDFGLQEPLSLPAYRERQQRALDIRMLVYFGSRERTVGDWAFLLGKVDGRFRIKDSKAASGQPNVIISVIWDATLEKEADYHVNTSNAESDGCTPEEKASSKTE